MWSLSSGKQVNSHFYVKNTWVGWCLRSHMTSLLDNISPIWWLNTSVSPYWLTSSSLGIFHTLIIPSFPAVYSKLLSSGEIASEYKGPVWPLKIKYGSISWLCELKLIFLRDQSLIWQSFNNYSLLLKQTLMYLYSEDNPTFEPHQNGSSKLRMKRNLD
jgi:hypothetical protein